MLSDALLYGHRLRHLPLCGGIRSGLLFWWGRLDVAAALVQQRDGWVDFVIFAQPVGEGGGAFLSGHLLFKLVQRCAMRRRTAEAFCGGDLCDLIGGDSHKIIAQSAGQPKRKGHALRIHAIEANAIFDGHIFCGKGFDLAQGGLFFAIFRLHSSAFVTQAWQGPQSYRTPVSRITAFA